MTSLLPSNATPFERALESVIAARIEALDGAVQTIGRLWNPWACPLELLPWLAWALSVDEWELDWTEQIKRTVVAGAPALHRHKGTPWAVEQALILAGKPFARVYEWFEYNGAPGHFKVVVDIEGETVSGDEEARLLRYVSSAKNRRSWMDVIEYNLSAVGDVPAYSVGTTSAEVITVFPAA